MTVAIGFDPGTTGAMAVLAPEFSVVFDLPTAKVGTMNQVDPVELLKMVERHTGSDTIFFIEQVHANAMSYKGNFALGHALGCIVTAVASTGRPMTRIQPKEWQAITGLATIPKADRKDAHRMRARELHPELADALQRKMDHNRADAILIADAGLRQIKERNSVTP